MTLNVSWSFSRISFLYIHSLNEGAQFVWITAHPTKNSVRVIKTILSKRTDFAPKLS